MDILLLLLIIISTIYFDIFSPEHEKLSKNKSSPMTYILFNLHWALCPILRCRCLIHVYWLFHKFFLPSLYIDGKYFYPEGSVPGIATRSRVILYPVAVQSHWIILLIYFSNIATNVHSHIAMCAHPSELNAIKLPPRQPNQEAQSLASLLFCSVLSIWLTLLFLAQSNFRRLYLPDCFCWRWRWTSSWSSRVFLVFAISVISEWEGNLIL